MATEEEIKFAFRQAYNMMMENRTYENTVEYFEDLYARIHKVLDKYPENRLLWYLAGGVYGYIADVARKEEKHD